MFLYKRVILWLRFFFLMFLDSDLIFELFNEDLCNEFFLGVARWMYREEWGLFLVFDRVYVDVESIFCFVLSIELELCGIFFFFESSRLFIYRIRNFSDVFIVNLEKYMF